MDSYEDRKWKNSEILTLIKEYKACPELWSPGDPNYLNEMSRDEAWNRISSLLDLTKLECKKKVFELLAEYKRIQMLQKRLEESGGKLERPWFAYDALKFLDERDVSKINDMDMPELNLSDVAKLNEKAVSTINYVKAASDIAQERKIITDFLKSYKECRCLWDPKSPLFANQVERRKKHEALLQIWKAIDPKSDIETVKKKLTNFRTVYRKERRKVENTKFGDSVYKPTLWYYEIMQFLDEADSLVPLNVAKDSNDCNSDVDMGVIKNAENTLRGTPMEREILIDIFQTYKKLRLLWDRKHPKHNDPEKRSEAYDILLEKWRQIYPNCNVDDVKRRLLNFRTVYNKQRKRVEICKQRGKVYTPTLWYYNLLRFLDEKDDLDDSIESSEANIKDEDTTFSNEYAMDDEDIEQDQTQFVKQKQHKSQTTATTKVPKRNESKRNADPDLMAEAVELLESTEKRLQASDEPREIKTFCSYISSKMCSYSVKMQREIEHAVYDVLVKADRGFFEQSGIDKRKVKKRKNNQVYRAHSTFEQSLQNIAQSEVRRSLRLQQNEKIPFEEISVIEEMENSMNSLSQNSRSGSEHETVYKHESVWLIDNYK